MSATQILEKTRQKIALTVNGAHRQVEEGTTVASLLENLQLDPRMVVVEHNRAILHDRESFANIPLNAGDTIEIVHFVGGG